MATVLKVEMFKQVSEGKPLMNIQRQDQGDTVTSDEIRKMNKLPYLEELEFEVSMKNMRRPECGIRGHCTLCHCHLTEEQIHRQILTDIQTIISKMRIDQLVWVNKELYIN